MYKSNNSVHSKNAEIQHLLTNKPFKYLIYKTSDIITNQFKETVDTMDLISKSTCFRKLFVITVYFELFFKNTQLQKTDPSTLVT